MKIVHELILLQKRLHLQTHSVTCTQQQTTVVWWEIRNLGLEIISYPGFPDSSSQLHIWTHRCSEKFWDFFFEMKIFSQKMCFLKILDIFEKSQNSIWISIIPFITCYKGNHRNPYRILGFFKIFQNFQKTYFLRFFHLEKKSHKFSEHLCRCKIFQAFQKSH